MKRGKKSKKFKNSTKKVEEDPSRIYNLENNRISATNVAWDFFVFSID